MLVVQNYSGLSDTLYLNKIEVKKVQFPPHPVFSVYPHFGNIYTDFSFDASLSYDDEDSISSLKYRWDWEGDEIWDTEYLPEPIITHRFTEVGLYNPTLEVTDSKGLSSIVDDDVVVDMQNHNLIVDFKVLPDSGTIYDEFIFDASGCIDIENPSNKLLYRWKLVGLNYTIRYILIKTEFVEDPLFTYKFLEEEFGLKWMYLDVMDENELIKTLQKEFEVYLANLPPTSDFKPIPRRGNVYTNYYFRSINYASDDSDFSHELQVRWDFENDGIWETDLSIDNHEVFHKYNSPGIYEVVCEAMDSEGLRDTCIQKIYVSYGTNETAYIEHRIPPYDKLKWKYYGIVKIGDQWWTSENMNFPELEEYPYLSTCYDNLESSCREYGGLYTMVDLFEIEGDDYRQPIPACPKGWHIPSESEWETLFSYYGGRSHALKELLPGGSSDFNVLMAGEKIMRNPNNPNKKLYVGQGSWTVLWSTTFIRKVNVRVYGFNSEINSIARFYNSLTTNRFSLRCIKD